MNRRRGARLCGGTALVASAVFALLVVAVLHAPLGLLPGDAALHHWSLTHRPQAILAFCRAVTATGTGVIPFAAVVLAGLLVGSTTRRRVITAGALVFCLGAGQALRVAVMRLVARPRPPFADWATHASGWSFPSGHATTGAMTAGLLIGALFLRGAPVPRLVAVLIGVWGAAVGLTRVYLGVHWFSDVVGGWLFATAWLALAAGAYLRGTRGAVR
ncbi:phosphatase PAP2 family protein [Streptomyces sp. NPDC052071]|uniref:phosphatase PAP2 family protein n=1 Tax=Streptomyces TaxID=1883 RepID=UPI0026E0025C|nr:MULTISPECIES: phosphatase PAP2 family protein [unclassified Streptomyces]MDX2621049.1 phosphatase PAP2 family protein [Streptomyces sp. WI03-5b]MDX3180493.1 phosphatase PAP2 family protein [Streptomyces sp. ME02-7008A-1]MDX3301234.1 phosphatase PAP2 family protein [Streptomyces sp. ME02-7008A]